MEKDFQDTETAGEITNDQVNWLDYITIHIYTPKKMLHIDVTEY